MRNRVLTGFAGLVFMFAPVVTLAQATDSNRIAAESAAQNASAPEAQSRETPPQPGQLAQPDAAKQPTQLPDTVSATPFTVRDKFDYRIVQSFGLRGFLGSALSAGVGQLTNTPHEWGQGMEGYSLRYGSSFGGNVSRQSFEWVLESAFHEDPRFFPSEAKSSGKERLRNVLRQTVFTKKDSNETEFAYARFISAFGAGQFVNVWLPRSDNSVLDGVERGFISLGADAAYNFLQEFFPFTRPISLRSRKPTAPTTP